MSRYMSGATAWILYIIGTILLFLAGLMEHSPNYTDEQIWRKEILAIIALGSAGIVFAIRSLKSDNT